MSKQNLCWLGFKLQSFHVIERHGSGADPGIFNRGGPRVFPKMSEVEGNFLEVNGNSYYSFPPIGGVWGDSPRKISGSEKCILVDPGDGFAMDNGERKNPSALIGKVRTPLPPLPDPPPAYATAVNPKDSHWYYVVMCRTAYLMQKIAV